MKTHRLLAPIALLVLVALPARAALPIVENFNSYTASPTDVTGIGSSPGFGGTGNGWLSGWRSSTSNTTVTAKVLDTTPLNSGGNYFSTTIATGATTSVDRGGIGRGYDFTGNSLATTAFNVNFDFRVDTLVANLRYDIFDTSARGFSPNSNTSWQLEAHDGFWFVRNGALDTSTGMAFSAATTYSISIGVNTATSKWSYSIYDGSTTVSGTALNFRGNGTNTDTNPAGARWFMVTAGEIADAAAASTTFSLDNLVISTIPEPSTTALLFGAATLGAVCIWRRRR
ncbi:MAG: PEP-CTERM sorting domain-containing protein [Opitutaceae bacterium]|jgi:hypothetical protein